MEFESVMEEIARGFEAVGVAIIVIGGVRRGFGKPLILGLEILVAADIVQTITVDPGFESVIVLGILVLVRVALSFSLDIEVDGIVPWRRVEMQAKLKAAGIDPETLDSGS
jgi:uncharacterized membrane protein